MWIDGVDEKWRLKQMLEKLADIHRYACVCTVCVQCVCVTHKDGPLFHRVSFKIKKIYITNKQL